MSATAHGIISRPIPQTELRFESDRYGVDMLTLVEVVPSSYFPAKFYPLATRHPRFVNMAISRRSAERVHAGKFFRISYLYEGYLSTLPEPTYELSGSLDQQPIATHPKFSSLAGTPSDPKNGAVWEDPNTKKPTTDDDVGVFREFGAGSGEKMGVDTYLDPGATWTKVSFSLLYPTLRNLGEIDSPEGPCPSLPGRNWLYWETSSRLRGSIHELRETWKLSGRGGWDSDIY